MALHTLTILRSPLPQIPNPNPQIQYKHPNFRRIRPRFIANLVHSPPSSTRFITFLGKGGSGKTTASVFAAKYFAKEGLRTCLVIHSQDPTAEQLMGCKIGPSPTVCSDNLSAIRLETSKMLLEPLERVKKVDARLNLTQGILEGVVGEELGILPGMDAIFSALALAKLVNFLPNLRKKDQREFDVVVYDGISTEETLRLIGVTERAKWYLKYIRNMAEKTDIGRVTSPSLLKLAYESARLNGGSTDGKTSTEIWNDIEQILERASVSFSEPSKIGCYLVVDPSRPVSVLSALRYWGCAIQAGTQVCGAFGFPSQSSQPMEDFAEKFLPLNCALMPYVSPDFSANWDAILNSISGDAKHLLHSTGNHFDASIRFDPSQKSVTLFMPGFDKSEIKLFQYRGGSELLVEAGDQRRVIQLPPGMQGGFSRRLNMDADSSGYMSPQASYAKQGTSSILTGYPSVDSYVKYYTGYPYNMNRIATSMTYAKRPSMYQMSSQTVHQGDTGAFISYVSRITTSTGSSSPYIPPNIALLRPFSLGHDEKSDDSNYEANSAMQEESNAICT